MQRPDSGLHPEFAVTDHEALGKQDAGSCHTYCMVFKGVDYCIA